mmetsp:Transcript_128612/g.222195  ORF Transcript_128612/g.222195 Transcript_128612/m.222195 type:complete len:160 (-) Transcript_128612:983-1462(-)
MLKLPYSALQHFVALFVDYSLLSWMHVLSNLIPLKKNVNLKLPEALHGKDFTPPAKHAQVRLVCPNCWENLPSLLEDPLAANISTCIEEVATSCAVAMSSAPSPTADIHPTIDASSFRGGGGLNQSLQNGTSPFPWRCTMRAPCAPFPIMERCHYSGVY